MTKYVRVMLRHIDTKKDILRSARDALGESGKLIWKSKTWAPRHAVQSDDFITRLVYPSCACAEYDTYVLVYKYSR